MSSQFTAAHRLRVKSLYKRYLKNSLDWTINRDHWRGKALQIRAEFERHRNIQDPRAVAEVLAKAEAELADKQHPDPFVLADYPGGTKWERNIPPKILPIYNHMEDTHH